MKNCIETYKATLRNSAFRFAISLIVIGLFFLLFLILFSIGNAIGEDIGSIFLLIWIICALAGNYGIQERILYVYKVGYLAIMGDYKRNGKIITNTRVFSVLKFRRLFSDKEVYTSYMKVSNNVIDEVYQGLLPKLDKRWRLPLIPGLFYKFLSNSIIAYGISRNLGLHASLVEAMKRFYIQRYKFLKVGKTIIVMTFIVMLLLIVVFTIIFSLIFAAIESTSGYAFLIGLVFAILFSFAIKTSFFDSYYENILLDLLCRKAGDESDLNNAHEVLKGLSSTFVYAVTLIDNSGPQTREMSKPYSYLENE